MKTDRRLCVVSFRRGPRGVGALAYKDGKIRTYLPGKEDGRILPFRRIKTGRALARHLLKSVQTDEREPVIAYVRHVKELVKWSERQFAQPA
jgi:hypothetical protein